MLVTDTGTVMPSSSASASTARSCTTASGLGRGDRAGRGGPPSHMPATCNRSSDISRSSAEQGWKVGVDRPAGDGGTLGRPGRAVGRQGGEQVGQPEVGTMSVDQVRHLV